MSKLSNLKQDAYQAGKDRDWARAIGVYEQILEADKRNPTVVNELGDVCLKAGEVQRAVRNFLNAASMYRKTGLLNNAVAILKKILRHDPTNLNAHWYLAETRAGQGLMVEGEAHGLEFLESSEEVTGDIKEIFLKRCVTLFELYPDSNPILEKLVQIFRMWEMNLEAARAQLLLCCLMFAEGKEDEAREAVGKVLAKEPSAANYPEFTRWTQLVNPGAVGPGPGFQDFGVVSLDGQDDSAPVPAAAAAPAAHPETSFADVNLDGSAKARGGKPARATSETSFADVRLDPGPGAGRSVKQHFARVFTDDGSAGGDPFAVDKDEDGCISIDADGGPGLEEVLASAARNLGLGDDGPQEGIPDDPATTELVIPDVPEPETRGSEPAGGVDLLAQILADGGGDLRGSDADQLKTITAEIGSQLGGGQGVEDADRLYEMGMVYLEMGMSDQACTSFAAAVADPAFTARAYEMWSMTLQRAHRAEEAVGVLEKGLQDGHLDAAGKLGLLYHLGKAHQDAGDRASAIRCFEDIVAVDPDYLDVGKRLGKLTQPV